jgi:hypothetical protein
VLRRSRKTREKDEGGGGGGGGGGSLEGWDELGSSLRR